MIQFILVCALSFFSTEAAASYGVSIRTAPIASKSARMSVPSFIRPLLVPASEAKYVGQAPQVPGNIIPISKQTRHNVEFREIPSTGSIQAATVEVGASSIPINIIFRSASSSLNVLQQHQGAIGDTQESSSEDEPHRLLHTVTKPIIQEIHEVISPFRKITQEVHPVQEEIQTIVARNNQLQQQQQQITAPVAFETINVNDGSLPKVLDAGIVSSTNVLSSGVDGKSTSSGLDKSLSKSVALVLGSSSSSSSKDYTV